MAPFVASMTFNAGGARLPRVSRGETAAAAHGAQRGLIGPRRSQIQSTRVQIQIQIQIWPGRATPMRLTSLTCVTSLQNTLIQTNMTNWAELLIHPKITSRNSTKD